MSNIPSRVMDDPMDIDSIVEVPDRPAAGNTKGKSRLERGCSDKARIALRANENGSRKVSLQAPPRSLRSSSISGQGSSTSGAPRNSFAFKGLVDDFFPSYANSGIQFAKSDAMQNNISDVYQDGPAEDLTEGYTNKNVSWGPSGGNKAVENGGNLLSAVQLHSEQSVANQLVASGINEGCGSVDRVLSFNHRGKGVESNDIPLPQARNTTSSSPNSTSSSRVTGQKRLVLNGCISPCNIYKTQQIVCEDMNGKVDDNGICQTLPVSSNGRQPGVSARMPVTDAQASHVSKGKGIMTYPLPMKDPGSQIVNSRDTMNIIEIAEEVDDINETFRSFGDLSGWRSTCKEHPLLPADHGSSSPPMRQRLNLSRSERNQHNVDHPLADMIRDDCSGGNLDDSGIVVLGSSRHTNESKPTRSRRHNRVETVERVIETDEDRIRSNGPNGASSRSRQDAMARQIEADEILARELQLRLYNQDLGVRFGEIDAQEALNLQDENTQHGSSRRRRHAFSDRSILAANTTRPSHVRHVMNISRTSSQALASIHRNQIPGQPRSLSSSRRSSSVFPAGMDVGLRMSILEALEAFNDMGVNNSMYREFNENDYEMLLALDENNVRRRSGASIRLINHLPQSTVQNDNGEEACVVCLETPTTGDVIRHLPCLHKFHKDCIDPWLRRKNCCPICKSSITRSV